MNSIPKEILNEIFLEVPDCFLIALVCHRFYNIIVDPVFYENKVRLLIGSTHLHFVAPMAWKEAYFSLRKDRLRSFSLTRKGEKIANLLVRNSEFCCEVMKAIWDILGTPGFEYFNISYISRKPVVLLTYNIDVKDRVTVEFGSTSLWTYSVLEICDSITEPIYNEKDGKTVWYDACDKYRTVLGKLISYYPEAISYALTLTEYDGTVWKHTLFRDSLDKYGDRGYVEVLCEFLNKHSEESDEEYFPGCLRQGVFNFCDLWRVEPLYGWNGGI